MRPDSPRPTTSGPDSGPEPPFPIRLSGPVIKGFGRGSKELGIPTANIPADDENLSSILPADLNVGVYYGVVALDPATSTTTTNVAASSTAPRILPAVLSIGYNPFYRNERRSVEIHILPPLSSSPSGTTENPAADNPRDDSETTSAKVKFNKLPDFYGATLNLLMLGYIRPEYDYVSLEALVEDIRVDCEVARRSLMRSAYRVYLGEEEDSTGTEQEQEQIQREKAWLRRF
ncbi:hypothetical protein ARAM_003800 [Aspergillus rambellii]|uniref:Riboflavin kinase n=1 Tax=Aspergillus rambellii TaxID=308745 RepID=A0A0F8TXJ4_9EURO|nr:hypothetical protein ARAM_003800 [Aspergillus rambellii]